MIQAVYKYVIATGDEEFLEEKIAGKSVIERMKRALEFLLIRRYDEYYGLLWGATTADWGDVQPEHEWGVYITDDTHRAIDIYDKAMFLIALDHFISLMPEKKEKWQPVRDQITQDCRRHLWNEQNQKFLPHIY